MDQNSNITSSNTSEHIETVSSDKNSFVLPGIITDKEINRNKPWRIVIRRVVSDGGSNYENISGEDGNNQSV